MIEDCFIVTKLEYPDNKKVKVYINYEYCFLLYKPDIKKYNIIEGNELSISVYEEIIEHTVFRRAKQKAIAILKYMDRTEHELRLKLKQASYTEDIIDRTIEYIKYNKFIDDERYTRYYIESKKTSKSKKQLIMELNNKGISKEILMNVLEDELENDDIALKKAIKKKTINVEELDKEDRQKLAASLYRKGFRSEDIRRYIFLD